MVPLVSKFPKVSVVPIMLCINALSGTFLAKQKKKGELFKISSKFSIASAYIML